MFLTALLRSARWTPGRQWIGRNRRTVKVTKTRRQTVLEREQHDKQVKIVCNLSCEASMLVVLCCYYYSQLFVSTEFYLS